MSAFHVGEWLVEPTLNSLSTSNSTVRLEPKLMQVLVCLSEHPGRVVSKDHLLQRVWQGTFVTEDVLTRAISELRHAFGDDAKHARFIQTIPKGGYRLVASVTPELLPIENVPALGGSTPASAVADLTGGGETIPISTARDVPGATSGLARRRRAALLVAAVAVMLGAGTWGTWRWLWPRPAAITGARPLTRSGEVMFPDRHLMQFPGLATDGARVFYTQGAMGPSWGEKLAQVSLIEGTTAIVPTPFRRQLIHHISPDRSRLLVQEQTTALGLDTREGALWAVPLAGQGLVRLGDVLGHDAAWSSSGSQLAFANGQTLYVAGWDGSNPAKLATTPGRAYWIRWAPDDRALRFTLTDAKFRTSLWQVRIDGTGLRRLLPDWRSEAQPCCGEWSPDGRHYVFVASENGGSNIWIKRESHAVWRTESGPVRLTSGPLNYASAIFSLDGRRLLAVSAEFRRSMIKFDLVSRQIEQYGVEGAPQFSRDRQWMVYVTPAGLWRSRIDGSDAVLLTTPPLYPGWQSLSPDGKQVAFISRRPGGPFKLYVVPSSGGAARQLIPGDRQEMDPSWSPDGNSIMFGRPPDVVAEHGMAKGIHLLDLKSGETTTLPGSDDMFAPKWTPDGRFVVAMPHENWNRLMRFDFATRQWSELVPYSAANPVVSPDGEWVHFESEHEGRHLSRVRLRDSRIERLVDYVDVTRGTPMTCVGPAGVDLDGSPLLHCFVNASELHGLDLVLP